jgi:hypothetical protein
VVHHPLEDRWVVLLGVVVHLAQLLGVQLRGGRIPVIVATPEVFGSCDGWGSAGSGAADGEA